MPLCWFCHEAAHFCFCQYSGLPSALRIKTSQETVIHSEIGLEVEQLVVLYFKTCLLQTNNKNFKPLKTQLAYVFFFFFCNFTCHVAAHF